MQPNFLLSFYFVILLSVLLSACKLFEHEVSQHSLIYTAQLHGELEPCGCTELADMGGIKRRVSAIDQIRSKQQNTLLISAGGLLDIFSAGINIKNQYILSAFANMNYDAIALAWRDLTFGKAFIKGHQLPLTAFNLGDSDFPTSINFIKAGQKFAFYQYLKDSERPKSSATTQKQLDVSSLKQALKQNKKQNVITIVSTQDKTSIDELIDENLIDVLLLPHIDETFISASLEDGTLILRPGSRGMYLGHVNFSIKNNKIIEFSDQHIGLASNIQDAKRMESWYQSYNEDVKVAYENNSRLLAKNSSDEKIFAGASACKMCHNKAYQVWKKSLHSKAFNVLQDNSKNFDPECVACHVVGFNEEGGFIHEAVSIDLMHVQCESCHGAAQKHTENPIKFKPLKTHLASEKKCLQCHNKKHSPIFDFDSYWQRIAHDK